MTQTPDIRRATPGDAPACVSILSNWIGEAPWMPRLHARASMEAFWRGRLAEATGWVAVRDDGAILGFALRDGPALTALYLEPDARRSGLGARLLEAARAGQDVLDLWVFAANTSARAFYAKAGFTEVGRTNSDNEEGLPDIALRWHR